MEIEINYNNKIKLSKYKLKIFYRRLKYKANS
jgi:hypothetical protein